jgi:hypothetical protein
MRSDQVLIVVAVVLAILAGWFGAIQVAWLWPFLLATSGILFAVASRQKR